MDEKRHSQPVKEGKVGEERVALTSKAAREAAISEVLQTQEISSQAQLAGVLSERGLVTTQATLSRDLLGLRAAKQRNNAGRNVYTLPNHQPFCADVDSADNSRLSKLSLELLVAADVVRNQLVLRTPPGGGPFLAAGVDAAWFDEVLGCVAGDDTVLVICRSDEIAYDLCERFIESINRNQSAL